MHHLRGAALCAVASLAGALLTGTVAGAATPSTALVLELKPTSETALHGLATSHGLSRAERARRLAALTPNAARVRSVASAVRSLGLSVDDTSRWSLRVHGPSSTVASLFGALPPATAQGAGRAYPLVPPVLDPYVVAALPTSGRVANPLATAAPRDGADFRAAYSAPAGGTGVGVAVATVQLSGWHNAQNDLNTYASSHHIHFTDPSQHAPHYIAVPVNGARTDVNDGAGGDEEVALDQDAILTTAPDATQVAYFASNTDGGDGYVDAIRQVGSEAAGHNTVALSLSWGGCEASDSRTWLAAMDQALATTLAAGVTIFAASGDAGSQDCIDELGGSAAFAPAVDYPASSPYVVGVGGSSLRTSGTTSVELGWDGSGGGESAYEKLPTWQFGVASHSPNNRRLVPDIASDADPKSGLTIYDSALPSPHTELLAGTSLASPTQAALLADTLSASGTTVGVGDLHAALYQGAASGAVADITHDVTSGGNGDYHSGPGYDLVTGLGSPVWTKLQNWFGQFDMGAPRATRSTSFAIHPSPIKTYSHWSAPLTTAPSDCSAATATTAPTSVQLPTGSPDGVYTFWVAALSDIPAKDSCHIGHAAVVLDRRAPRTTLTVQPSGSGVATARWSFADGSPSSAMQKFVLVATSAGKTQWTYTTTARSRVFNALPHGRWRLRVTAYDNAGNTATAAATLYDDTTAFSFGSRWKHVSATAAFRHGFERARTAGSSARASVTGQKFVLYVETCRSCGRLGVYDGHGRHLTTIDTYSWRTHYRVPVTVLTLTHVGTRTLVVRVLPRKNASSTGHDAQIDALAVF